MSSKLDFKTIYDTYFSKIQNYLIRLIGSYHAEDITQEVFSKVNSSLKTLEEDSNLSTWLYRIATNTAIDKTRTLSFKYSKENENNEDSKMIQAQNTWTGEKYSATDQALIKEEMRECVQDFIDRLPDDYKTVLILREYEGRSNKEIAQILDITIHTAKIRYHRAKVLLKKELDSGCDFFHDDENNLQCDRKPSNGILPKLPK
jgi:RNA polymerase sigma-70 factor (ECF subfamily)